MTQEQDPVIPDGRPLRSAPGWWFGVAGIIVHCTVIAFLYLAAGLVAPLYGLLVLFVVWVALLLLGIRWLRGRNPSLAFGIPFLAVGAWLGVLTFGDYVLGWTA